MNPLAIAQLIASLLPSLLNLYNEIAAQYQGQVQPIEEILKAANVNWDQVAAAAQKEIDNTPTT